MLVINEEKCVFLGGIILQLSSFQVLSLSPFYSEFKVVRFFLEKIYQLLGTFEWQCLKVPKYLLKKYNIVCLFADHIMTYNLITEHLEELKKGKKSFIILLSQNRY